MVLALASPCMSGAVAAARGDSLPGAAELHRGVEALYRKDYPAALRWFTSAADKGNANAEFNIGFMYKNGTGVPQDYARAILWFRAAAAKGNVPALDRLGQMFYDGTGVKQDYVEAMDWSRAAAAKSFIPSDLRIADMYLLGEGVAKDSAQGLRWLKKATDEPLDAQEGIDDQMANRWKAKARFLVGNSYENGTGTEKNIAEAINWYRSAAALGSAEAQAKLAQLNVPAEAHLDPHPDLVFWCDMLDMFGRTHRGLISIDTRAKYVKIEATGQVTEVRDGAYAKPVTAGIEAGEGEKVHQIVIIDGDVIKFGGRNGNKTILDTLDLRTGILRTLGRPSQCTKAGR
ncbi:MAG TPA: tetratricopeptide repeat protein [Xanthobacteraceae bacterium]|nr:tetratricopeptide repeat protein [Xanthobacteraceae bacterium]